ncbi:MAG: conjugal transfer protein TraH [Gallionella sp.]
MRYKKIIISIIAATCLTSAPANANVGAGMQNWFDSMGGFTNVTPPSSYKGQTMNGYSGGGFYQRVPVKNYQLAAMTPPSLNIGCGGIDLTAGSFSFINKAALTSMFQNVGTSLSYAFLLAIKSSMPQMSSLFEYLQDASSKINSLNVNSCQMAEGIVTAGKSMISDKKKSGEDHSIGSYVNGAVDSFGAWNSAEIDKLNARRQAETQDPTQAEVLSPGNVVWTALSKTTGLDDQDKEFIMSMTGTVIIRQGTGTAKTTWDYVPPTQIDIEDLVGTEKDTGATVSVQVFVCADKVKCLNVTQSALPVASFMQRVALKLDGLRNNLLARTQQTTGDLQLVEMSSIPVWKMISVATNYNPGYIDEYKRVIAVDLAFSYINGALTNARQILSKHNNSTGAADAAAALDKLIDNLDKNSVALYAARQAEYQKITQNIEMQQKIQLMHQTMIAGLPAQAFNSITVFGSK